MAETNNGDDGPMEKPSAARTAAFTAIAMVAFAANSVLTRMALDAGHIDAVTFATIRMSAGAVTLGLIVLFRGGGGVLKPGGDWRPALMLFSYMACFSFAYRSLSTGTGALILFGAVQISMFVVALRQGEHFPVLSWIGLACAIGGLIYLVSPGLSAPDPVGAVLMAVAGTSWGAYSLLGRGAKQPLAATARNFVYAVPLVLAMVFTFPGHEAISANGIALAIASGAVASGCGYAIWYAALPGLTASSAATVQLSVPAIAALGGVLLLSESVSTRLVVASIATLGGVAVVLTQRTKPKRK